MTGPGSSARSRVHGTAVALNATAPRAARCRNSFRFMSRFYSRADRPYIAWEDGNRNTVPEANHESLSAFRRFDSYTGFARRRGAESVALSGCHREGLQVRTDYRWRVLRDGDRIDGHRQQ